MPEPFRNGSRVGLRPPGMTGWIWIVAGGQDAIPADLQATIWHSRAMTADFSREQAAMIAGRARVAGVDEVGRGPLAGPVVAAAVILDPSAIPDGLADSKELSAQRREELCVLILASALAVGVGSASATEIDTINIRQATLLSMRRAVGALPLSPDLVLVDGNDPPALACGCEAIIGGDGLIASIAAASIVAKVMRDRMMARLSLTYPAYGFASHAGYGTAAHRAAIKEKGPCPAHRYSFAPIKGVWTR
ncbi:Ribonuclease HII [Bosea sp. 62]|nr:Ribonuclease HII [Bosea sp. 7B]CAD5298358.1 Ribonuclease HII [Bosea sp. 21B]CAD5298529.1 Ribonuclease HII [Bosea sp. 46]VVT61453.1 Ribonuclease HII [Bosea sp. EC-HK365B]VXB14376.1 Ribonuclease HII [Bosea sp. 127]VXB28829.1 Ribonuclease HII [Bosea sp. 125]VXC82374.1 Ribonuclease HII [Bosea sp. 62]VXC84338.1 Ribonuclease HII [Bosea sp. 29B]